MKLSAKLSLGLLFLAMTLVLAGCPKGDKMMMSPLKDDNMTAQSGGMMKKDGMSDSMGKN